MTDIILVVSQAESISFVIEITSPQVRGREFLRVDYRSRWKDASEVEVGARQVGSVPALGLFGVDYSDSKYAQIHITE